ncbi:ABC transporter permease [Nonomuraea gerenzanensis]|uniref:Transport permease protein n=1 Tax=Nonomuraea gerenzanensis TaxID=93944 RepID=A0A1M4DWX6_9ACTN|nr:ABC transporter permease [Nonomuraea gerenzanensis]UBU13417.1 ABC transporter permease [Nonomuraea gerenzanensis]SBO91078.1 integral membrane protein [Nonomuraea gerenzanensis]
MKLLVLETKLHLRDWPTLLFTIGLPVGLLLVLGFSIPDFTQPQEGGQRIVDTHMPSTMALLSLLTLSCSVLPAVLATYRQQGVLRRMSTTPVHPARVLGAQLVINLGVGTVSTIVLIVAGWLAFGAAPPRQWAWFVLVFLLGTAALLAIGLVIAALAPSAKSAPGIGSMVMFPLMFLGGVWVPREVMPDALRVVSDFSVAGPFAQALKDTWAGQPPQLLHLVVVAAGLAVFGGLAVRWFRWE